ncbi:thymidine phosphorylase [Coraliomargarita sp. SDUM461003]|uniref:thymidine phosphorylase n=2 Tax=Thalassobacterium maritimum TaxID=3041265 RepID=A0ABU1AS03_9BACT|nr:thymidine phosphorylase [Coraliomargarita sp. SDUM461003]MDQ8206034.1 thymidine phosphorylase [Coraliomargarita sp. SDUM461003]
MKMLPQEIIARKRDGLALTRAQVEAFVTGVVSGDFKDYQSSALLMAIVLKGMSPEETGWLTEAMMRSGRIVELPEITRPKVDKHSTGGVGDKVSLILAPLVAACGLCVPMMSGRGLGHTGGTLDKLEAIPGFRTELSDAAYRQQLQDIHQAMIGQSADMVPADRKLYALRDVTATVESIPLICSSILGKKLAEGIDALVLDVKFGHGAFMPNEASGRELAEALVAISASMGKPTSALLTRMEQPLGRMIGNSLEVIEAIDCLRGEGPEDLMEVTYALCAEMLMLGGIHSTVDDAMAALKAAIQSGAALAGFRELIAAQGGDPRVIDDYKRLPLCESCCEVGVESTETMYVSGLDARSFGEAACLLGAGRVSTDSVIDPAVGLELLKKVGDRVQPGEPIVRIHYRDEESCAAAEARLQTAIHLASAAPSVGPLVVDRISHKS